GLHAGTGHVQRKLPDRNAHAVRAKIAETQNALAIGDDDHANIVVRPVRKDLADMATLGGRYIEPSRTTEDVPILLAGLPDRRRIDDRHQLRQMVDKHVVEQRLIAVLETDEAIVPIEIALLRAD